MRSTRLLRKQQKLVIQDCWRNDLRNSEVEIEPSFSRLLLSGGSTLYLTSQCLIIYNVLKHLNLLLHHALAKHVTSSVPSTSAS
jgi:hypothetical protein